MKNYAYTNEELNEVMDTIKNSIEYQNHYTIAHFTRRCQIAMACREYGLKCSRPTKANAYLIITAR